MRKIDKKPSIWEFFFHLLQTFCTRCESAPRIPERVEGVKSLNLSVDEGKEGFSICSPGVVLNTWGTPSTNWHQRARTQRHSESTQPHSGDESSLFTCFQRQHLAQISHQPVLCVTMKDSGLITRHRQIRKCRSSTQRQLFLPLWAFLSCSRALGRPCALLQDQRETENPWSKTWTLHIWRSLVVQQMYPQQYTTEIEFGCKAKILKNCVLTQPHSLNSFWDSVLNPGKPRINSVLGFSN